MLRNLSKNRRALAFLALSSVAIDTASGQCSRELLPDGLDQYDHFGHALATDGVRLAAVAPNQWASGDLIQVYDLVDGEPLFSIHWYDVPGAVDLDGSVLAVGQLGMSFEYGDAALYDAATGQGLGALVPSVSELWDFFGFDVAVEGGSVVVGAPSDPITGAFGAAYVFDVATLAQVHVLTPSDGSPRSGFGYSVDVEGDVAAVGNPFDDTPEYESGSAYLFDLTTGQELRKVTPTGPSKLDLFGASVAIEGPRVFVGAPGARRVVAFDLATGAELYRIQSTAGDFGRALDVHGDRLVVGAPLDGAGSASVFEAATCAPLGRLELPAGAPGDAFGTAVAVGPGTAAVGAPSAGWKETGRAALFPLVAAQVALDCDPAQPNSTGAPATLAAVPCGPVVWNELRLEARDMPAHQIAYFLAGDRPAFVQGPGGSQGDLCVGGDLRRFFDQLGSTGPDGTLAIQVDLAHLPGGGAVLPGETWHFQAWYRDKNPGPTSNFSPAAAVTFP